MYNIAVWFVEVYSVKQIKIPLYETPKPPKKEANIEDLVQKKIMQLLGSNGFPKLVPGEEQEEKQPTTPFSVKENSLFDDEDRRRRELSIKRTKTSTGLFPGSDRECKSIQSF